MKQFSFVDFVLGVGIGSLIILVANLIGRSHEKQIKKSELPTPSKSNLTVLIQVKASSDWNFVYGGEIPYGGSLIVPTEIGVLNFTHSK